MLNLFIGTKYDEKFENILYYFPEFDAKFVRLWALLYRLCSDMCESPALSAV